jgi:hypothetical protein
MTSKEAIKRILVERTKMDHQLSNPEIKKMKTTTQKSLSTNTILQIETEIKHRQT